jgi:hypothetical protein
MKSLLYGVWTYQETTMCGLTVSSKGLLYGVWTYLGRAFFLQCVDLPRKIILYSVVLTISEGHFGGIGLIWQCTVFIQCMDLPWKGI